KLAAGCLLALGVGAGCVALGGGATSVQHRAHQRHATTRRSGDPLSRAASAQTLAAIASAPAASSAAPSAAPSSASGASGGSPARQASREFGPEQSIAGGGQSHSATAAPPLARAASVGPTGAAPPAVTSSEAGGGQSAGVPAAQREFAPG
ncbi:MAG TPA: hypothetical protein VHS26_00620, partial [Solirubrobacteraceae bacterium]|nr:hypothetical protein [Solirubrobacteraceae bacterium]